MDHNFVKSFNENFCKEQYDENGLLKSFELTLDDNFNFGYDVIDAIAKEEPDKLALLWCNPSGEERRFTFSDLMKKSNQTANMLLANGVRKGDMVMCVLKRHYQFWFVTIALCKIGAIMIPATNQLTKKDYVYRFNSGNVSYLIATSDGDVPKHAEAAMEEYDGIKKKFIVKGNRDGWVSFDEEIEKYPETLDRIETKLEDKMLAFFSSGTTGYPKMVIHTHDYAAAHIATAKHWHNLHDKSLHLTISETGWGKAMWGKMYGQFIMGATVFVYDFDRFVPAEILSLIEKYKITSLCCSPTMYRFFIKEGMEGYDLSSLEYATVAGEALNPEVFNKFYEYTGLKLMEGFGQTETVIAVANLVGSEPKPGSMGKPVPLYDIAIVDENGNVVPDGETGEIVFRTEGKKNYGLFKGYYNSPETTNKAWHDGLYHTGDTAWRDEDGYFWYVGRTDDVIKASGYRIGPFEIESVLMEHPAVLEVAVTGAKDPIRGQVVKATIVLTKDYKDKASEVLVKELQEHVKRQTAPYKYPRIVEFVDELPKTISGKIRRVEIRERDNSTD